MRALVLVFVVAAPCFGQTAETYRRAAIEFSRHQSGRGHHELPQGIGNQLNDALTHYNLALALKYNREYQIRSGGIRSCEASTEVVGGALRVGGCLVRPGRSGCRDKGLLAPLKPSIQLMPRSIVCWPSSFEQVRTDAERELKLAVRLKPSAGDDGVGVVEGQLGKFNDAVIHFREAIRLDRLATAHVMLGIALRRQGRQGRTGSVSRRRSPQSE